jgi:hypothetical protein
MNEGISVFDKPFTTRMFVEVTDGTLTLNCITKIGNPLILLDY